MKLSWTLMFRILMGFSHYMYQPVLYLLVWWICFFKIAKANCRLVGLDLEKKGLLPIQIVLEMLRSDEIVKNWKPYAQQFMIKLITVLCNPKLICFSLRPYHK